MERNIVIGVDVGEPGGDKTSVSFIENGVVVFVGTLEPGETVEEFLARR